MPDSSQPVPNSFSRPSARPGMPIQRANYGIPPRQTAVGGASTGQRFMDVSAPTAPSPPVQPTIAPAQTNAAPVAAQPQTAPTQTAAPINFTPTAVPTQAPQRPLFSATPTPKEVSPEKSTKSSKLHSLLPKLRLVLFIVGVLVTVGGAARWATAGSIANDTIAVGAVTANDGHTISVQFTADDGKLHRFTIHGSDAQLIPGSAMQVAYQPGAPDGTAKEVSVVKAAHNLGVSLFLTGILLLVAGGALSFFGRHRPSKSAPVEHATPVTV